MYGKPIFDSHDFILTYIREFPYSYFNMLHETYKYNVTHTDSGIANFLRNNSSELGIEKIGTNESLNILSNPSECAIWERK